MQVIVGLDGGSMLTVFPERPLPRFELIVCLRRAADN
jgi:hypothetical protein